LPRFGLVVVAFFLFLIGIFIFIAELIVIVDVIVDVVIDAMKTRRGLQNEAPVGHELGSDAGLILSRFGGGYVDQK
jgi:hypothetical protein